MGPKTVVIKRGEYGALLFENGDVFSAPAFPVEGLKDPTGAGDTFAGALLGVLASEDNADTATLRRAVIYGSALASLCVENIGTDGLGSCTRTDIERRFKEFRKLAHFAFEEEIQDFPESPLG
jgi:sugar/nucleoside kinase (ribokinase family)